MSEELRQTIASRDNSLESLTNEVAERRRTQSELVRQAEELTRARIAAESATQAKSQFLASMSHEIRTPINGVLGMAELLANSELSEKQRRFARTILNSGRSLLGIINDILDLSKIEARKLDLDSAPFDLRLLLDDVVQQLATIAHQKGLELICDVSLDANTAVRGDAQRLRQILVNLIGNAIKFTEHGQIVVRLRPARESTCSGQSMLRFDVIDTGIGISREAQARIFESFTQADGSTSRKFGGTGLGLTICRKLVSLMGGGMGVESELGSGSNFWFTAVLGRGATTSKTVTASSTFHHLNVMILDDNDTSREILERQLKAWQIPHVSVPEGRSALDLLRRASASGEPYNVVLVDRFMPSVDGLEFARLVRNDADLAGTRLVMLSSMTEDKAIDEWRALAFVGSLTKPLRQSDLYRCLRSLDKGHGPCAPNKDPCCKRPDIRASTSPISPKIPGYELTEIQAENQTGGMQKTKIAAKILVAEDNPVNQEIINEVLVQLGCRVAIVEDGNDAIRVFKDGGFDLVFMDCQMPGADGFDATASIRRYEKTSGKIDRTPIIAVTANAMEGDRDHCLSAGMDDYLAKPFMHAELVAMLSQWLPDKSRILVEDIERSIMPNPADSACDQKATQIDIDPAALKRIRDMAGSRGRELLIKIVERYLQKTPAASQRTVGSR